MPFRLERAFIRVSGPDAIGFLDNLLTQSVAKLDAPPVLYGALLTPQGKVIADMFLWAEADKPESVLLELDPARAEDVRRRLFMYKLRANVALDIAAEWVVLWDPSQFGNAAPDPRLPNNQLGWRMLSAASAASSTSNAALFTAQRITLGVPNLAEDAGPDEVFALEALLEEMNGVDFQKGCFVGQENVSRMKRRATTRKKFCAVVFDGAPPAYGTIITAGEAELGSVRTGMEGRAIALLRLDRALDALAKGVEITAGGKQVRLDPPPWLILPVGE